MPDLSMAVYLGRIKCDAPSHISVDESSCDYEDDHLSRREFLANAKYEGWIFRRDGTTICPACALGEKA